MEGKKDVPGWAIRKNVVPNGRGSVIFKDEDRGTGMYSVLNCRLAIRNGKGNHRHLASKSFCGMAFSLDLLRAATAMELESADL